MRPRTALTIVVGLGLLGCTTTTGTRLSPTSAELAQVKRLAAVVITEEAFSVRRERDRMTATSAAAGGLLGYAIESGVRSSRDARHEAALKAGWADVDIARLVASRLVAMLRAAPPFAATETTDTRETAALRRSGFDSLLEVAIKEWGLRLCNTSSQTEELQVGFRTHGRLIALGGGTTIWERHDVFVDGTCSPAEAFGRDPALLTTALTRAADGLAVRLANEILFP